MLQEFDIILLLLVDIRFKIKTKYPAIVRYSPIFVNDRDKLPNIGASILNRFLISNWSNGLVRCVNLSIFYDININ